MINKGQSQCPDCGCLLSYYDKVKRTVKTKNGAKEYIYICRFRCTNCNRIHRELDDRIFPYKHYDSEIIFGVLEGLITSDTFGFEDYPCEQTMKNWKDTLKPR